MSLQSTFQPNLHQNRSTRLNPNPCLTSSIQVPAQTLGAEMQAAELASHQVITFPDGIQLSTAFDVDPDDFERIYQWFLS